LPKNSVICAKIPVSQSLSAKKSPPRATDAFGLPLSGNNPSAQRKQGTCKKALNLVQIYRQIACPNLQEPEECSIFVVPLREWSGLGEEFQAGALPEKETGRENKGNRPSVAKTGKTVPQGCGYMG
jgi:hypothetical protein